MDRRSFCVASTATAVSLSAGGAFAGDRVKARAVREVHVSHDAQALESLQVAVHRGRDELEQKLAASH